MNDPNFVTAFSVDQTPHEAFAAIINVRGWWSEEIEGTTGKLGAEFTYHDEDGPSLQDENNRIRPRQKVVWLVLDNYFDFTEDKPSGKAPRSFSKSLRKTIKRNFVSLTRV